MAFKKSFYVLIFLSLGFVLGLRDHKGIRTKVDTKITPKQPGNEKILTEERVELSPQSEAHERQSCDTSPCVNGGTCEELDPDSYKCHCTSFFMGEDCLIEPLSNVALSLCGAQCTASSIRSDVEDCYSVISDKSPVGNGPFWATDSERVGAWLNVDFTDYYRIKIIAIFDRYDHARSSLSLLLETSDLKSTQIDLMCLGTNVGFDKFWQHFDLVPTVSSYMKITVDDVCDKGSRDFVGFRGIQIYANEVALMNAASVFVGASCTSSSAYDENYSCQNAIDGVEDPGVGNEWATNGEGEGAWIQINLNRSSTVVAVGFLQRCSQASQNNLLTLEFSESDPQEIQLECFTTGVDPLDCDGQYWQQFDLNPHVVTSFVRVTISSVCSADNNGFREIRVFSLKEEPND